MEKVFRLLLPVFLIIIIIFTGEFVFEKFFKYPQKVEYGVSFTPGFARFLSLDWKKTYLEIINELKVKNIRISSYWSDVEKIEGKYDFSEIDFMLDEAEKKGVNIVLVLGVRQPRWPECHIPEWAKKLTVEKRQQKILEFITKTLEQAKSNKSIIYWQVENEPLLASFGKGCDSPDKEFFKKEVELVRSLDTRLVIVTDSGELGVWVSAMKLSDIFGTTMYRTVYNPFFGYSNYPLLPYLYNIKSQIVKNLFASSNQKTIVMELQTEPWFIDGGILLTPIEKQIKLFSVNTFKNNISYVEKTGFDTVYLWGVEWWYWMAKQAHPEYLEYAKNLFK